MWNIDHNGLQTKNTIERDLTWYYILLTFKNIVIERYRSYSDNMY